MCGEADSDAELRQRNFGNSETSETRKRQNPQIAENSQTGKTPDLAQTRPRAFVLPEILQSGEAFQRTVGFPVGPISRASDLAKFQIAPPS